MRQASHAIRLTGVGALAVAVATALVTVLIVPAGGSARGAATPANTVEPKISGNAAVGSTLSASRGSWSNSPTNYDYQWVRCPSGGGKSDGSDCAAISGATTTSYVVGNGDVNRRLRVRVTASNSSGSRVAASNATALISSSSAGKPVNTVRPTLSGTAQQDQTLHVVPGTWTGSQPITFTFDWLRCDSSGNNCIVQPGFTDDSYTLRPGDVDRTMRARVNADNGSGTSRRLTLPSAKVSPPSGPIGMITLPNGEKSIPPTSVPPNERLVVDQVVFSPSPVRSQTRPITVRIKIKDTRGLRRPRRRGVLPLDPARHAQRPEPEDGAGRLAPARDGAREGLSRDSRRLRRAVLREGISNRRSPARRDQRHPARPGSTLPVAAHLGPTERVTAPSARRSFSSTPPGTLWSQGGSRCRPQCPPVLVGSAVLANGGGTE